jgi:protein-disulfide isomerase
MKLSWDSLLFAVAVTGTVVIGYLSVQPGGTAYSWLVERRALKHRKTLLASEQHALQSVGQVSGEVGGSRVVVEFADYECPFCRQATDSIERWMQKTPGAAILYVHFPIASHIRADTAAAAAICAEQEGRFDAMHYQLMSTETWQRDGNWLREARAAGIRDLVRFNACLTSPGTQERIATGRRIGTLLGLFGTPTFMSWTGKQVSGLPTVQALDKLR